MKLKYSQRKQLRVKNQFDSVTVWTRDGESSMWWQESTQSWVCANSDEWDENSYHFSHHSKGQKGFPRTEKAVLNYLKRHEKELHGRDVVIDTRWVGHYAEVIW